MKINKLIILILILFTSLGLFLRFYKIESIPPHLSADEISIAYDAYSLNRTLKDEHNDFLPLSFKSYGTYKAPGYIYVLSPLFSFLKNNNFTARLPSIISGLLTTLIIGLIAFQITNNKYISIISSIILLISPWHVVASRAVLESNLALLFLSLAIYLFLKSISIKKIIFVYLSLFLFVASMYCYHTEWGFSPLLFMTMIFIFYRKNLKKILFPVLIFIILTLPLFLNYLSNLNTSARANTELIWKSEAVMNSINTHSSLLSPLVVLKTVFEKYLDYININTLFFNGTDYFNQGLFLWPLILPFFTGILFLKKNIKEKYYLFFICFTLLSPLISAFTKGPINLIRNLNSVLPYTIIIAIGLYNYFLNKTSYKFLIYIFLVFTSIYYFSISYFLNYPLEKANTYQSYRPIATFLQTNSKNYEHIYVDYNFSQNCRLIGVPQLYFSYYQSLNPKFLQNRIDNNLGTNFDKYTISKINWKNINLQEGSLYIVPICNSPKTVLSAKLELVSNFNDYAGNPAFEIWKAK